MFFFLSKLASFFITPENWIIVLLISLFFVKSPLVKKRVTIILVIFVLFFGNEVIYNKIVLAWQPKPVQLPPNITYEAGILLGGSGSFDKNGTGFLNSSSDRVFEVCTLYKTGKIKKIIVAAGAVYNDRPKEAPFLSKKISELGIPPHDIIVEQQSRTTFENALYTKRIIDSLKLQPPFVLVTSAMHIPRSVRVFTKAGLPVIPYPADYKVLDKKFGFFDYAVPKLYIINDWSGLSRELVGVLGYKLFKKA
ncbi:MAG: hypothetical protein JWQ40_898 [Segetibacter sp.]|jgi:uncharacterized SAM-binding protein YcdF (DUF218 family)|nr:hypothetical protein [Segetibacter sp.]